MASAPVVGVVGMRALARDLAKLTSDRGALYKALSSAAKSAANPVAAQAKSHMQSDTTPNARGPHLVDDIRTSGTRTGASIRMGRNRVRWAGWVEFGGTRRTPRTSTRDYRPQGRYLWPAARQLAGQAATLYSQATEEAVSSFRWSNEGTAVHD
jgi:hypothetical protein